MQILILNWRDPKNPLSGGAEIVTEMHAKAWVAHGHTVSWLTSRFPGALPCEHIDGVEIIRFGGAHTVHLIAPFFYLFSGRKFNLVIDEIHGLPFFTPLYVRKPKIAFIHEVAGKIWDYMLPFPLNMFGKFIESCYFFFYRNVAFWTDANSTIDELATHGIQRSSCVAIACPAPNAALSKLPKKEHTLTLIFVSRLVPMKGVTDVIRAFSLIVKKQKAKLWIVGDGDYKYRRYLTSLTESLNLERGAVQFFGRVDEQKKLVLLRRAHILLHASIKEGWGLVIVEAASQGTPSVVYDVPGLRDSVQNGVTGTVVSNNTPEDLAAETLRLVKNKKLYETYQKNCLLLSKKLSWLKVTKQSMDFISKVAGV